MNDVPERALFSIEEDGTEYDVAVSREVFALVLGSDGATDEAAAGWLQDNLEDLSRIAQRKLAADRALAQSGGVIRITERDWRDRGPRDGDV